MRAIYHHESVGPRAGTLIKQADGTLTFQGDNGFIAEAVTIQDVPQHEHVTLVADEPNAKAVDSDDALAEALAANDALAEEVKALTAKVEDAAAAQAELITANEGLQAKLAEAEQQIEQLSAEIAERDSKPGGDKKKPK